MIDMSNSHIIQLAQQIAVAGAQGAKAYNDAQAELRLELVLTPGRLGSVDGTHESLTALGRLAELNAAHKEMFGRFMTAAIGQMVAAIGALPEDQAQQHRTGMLASVNWQMDAQSRFYAQRDEWIATARRICELVDIHRTAIELRDGELLFFEDDALESFLDLVARADELHRLEVEQTAVRLSRLSQSIQVLDAAR